jgi:hypothetical protein
MGKPYATEVAALDETYTWARSAPLATLEQFVGVACGRPLLSVGSGGSATAAHFASMLHRFVTGSFARHVTPLEAILGEPNISETAVLLLSASGRNKDVLATLRHCIRHDARAIATLCTKRASPLAKATNRFERGYACEADLPSGKDGFLATNSLLATCVMLARAYGVTLEERITVTGPDKGSVVRARGRSSVQVLHGGWASPVATDLESKLNESAIGAAQVSDYRNFGHGRHLWLARRARETAAILLVTPSLRTLAKRTRALFPREIPIIELTTEADGPAGTINLLTQAIRLVGVLGSLQRFDPGRPVVPAFGRKLYQVAPPLPPTSIPPPVERKLSRALRRNRVDRETYITALNVFVEELREARLGGLVLDYDGTLCGRANRFGRLRSDILSECQRLLAGGIVIGIATGRGRSVRDALQDGLPRQSWQQVVVGYYNGGDIAALTDTSAPSRDGAIEPLLTQAARLLENVPAVKACCTLTIRPKQITVEPTAAISTDRLMSEVMTVLAPLEEQGVRVLASSHSVDVLPCGVGKLAVVDVVKQRVGPNRQVLCIGDRGAWPGNDCALLTHQPSLSVDEVSSSFTTCWNLVAPGLTGPDAALRYLRAVRLTEGSATFDGRDFWKQS